MKNSLPKLFTMKTILNTLFFLVSISLSSGIFAYPEIPFCPAGGAPGWMNYLDYKRNQNSWQRNYYSNRYPPINYGQFNQYAPHTVGQNTTPATYRTPYRSLETPAPGYYYNNFPNNYRNKTYVPRNYSPYTTPIK